MFTFYFVHTNSERQKILRKHKYSEPRRTILEKFRSSHANLEPTEKKTMFGKMAEKIKTKL